MSRENKKPVSQINELLYIMKGNYMNVLFIGNSHTYFNDMPRLFALEAERHGVSVRVTMLAHGGWTLKQHLSGPEARFNILYGGYDHVILQEHSHPFAQEDEYLSAVKELCALIRRAGAVPVIYETWSRKKEPEVQTYMNEIHARAARENGALLAPVGEHFRDNADAEMYFADGEHPSREGSLLAAKIIWDTVAGGF